jgi:hypothetical protein
MLCFQFFQRRLLKQTEHQSPRRAQPKVSTQDVRTDPFRSLLHNPLSQSFSEAR